MNGGRNKEGNGRERNLAGFWLYSPFRNQVRTLSLHHIFLITVLITCSGGHALLILDDFPLEATTLSLNVCPTSGALRLWNVPSFPCQVLGPDSEPTYTCPVLDFLACYSSFSLSGSLLSRLCPSSMWSRRRKCCSQVQRSRGRTGDTEKMANDREGRWDHVSFLREDFT